MQPSHSPPSSSIELHITVSLQTIDYLFDYNSSLELDSSRYRTIRVSLSLPKRRQCNYYFFHKHRSQPFKPVKIQHRKEFKSKIAQNCQLSQNYKLIGGVCLKQNQKGRILMTPIAASDIPKQAIGHTNYNEEMSEVSITEQISTFLPYLVLRSFPKGLPLKEKQILKFGKKSVEVREIHKQIESEKDMLQRGQIIIRKDWEDGDSEQDKETKHICRYCQEQDSLQRLIDPCPCRGSLRYVHYGCLRKELEVKYREAPDNGNKQSFLPRCSICKHCLPKVFIKNDRRLYMLEQFRHNCPYIQFQESYFQDYWLKYSSYYIRDEEGQEMTIGRNAESKMMFCDTSVSRFHSKVEVNSIGQYVIKDRQSKFGTLLYERGIQVVLNKRISRVIQIQNLVFGFRVADLTKEE